jgi:phosphatidylglycerophosphate synthase
MPAARIVSCVCAARELARGTSEVIRKIVRKPRPPRRPDGPGTQAARPLKPTIAQLREVAQPPAVLSRANAEHWAGLAYGRKVSIYLTRAVLNTRVTPDGLTWAMGVCGGLAAIALSIPGLWTAVAAAALIQLQLIVDCSDGELARWRNQTGASGVYIDRIGHYVTEAGLIAALGIRAGGGWTSLDGWATVGFATAVLAVLVRAETDLVHVARAQAGLPKLADAPADITNAGMRGAKAMVKKVPVNRALVALEFSTLALLAALADGLFSSAGGGGVPASQALAAGMLPLAAAVAGGHLLAIVMSNRLQGTPST